MLSGKLEICEALFTQSKSVQKQSMEDNCLHKMPQTHSFKNQAGTNRICLLTADMGSKDVKRSAGLSCSGF